MVFVNACQGRFFFGIEAYNISRHVCSECVFKIRCLVWRECNCDRNPCNISFKRFVDDLLQGSISVPNQCILIFQWQSEFYRPSPGLPLLLVIIVNFFSSRTCITYLPLYAYQQTINQTNISPLYSRYWIWGGRP